MVATCSNSRTSWSSMRAGVRETALAVPAARALMTASGQERWL